VKWKTRITVLLTALFGHKLAWAATTGVIAGVTASQIGRDPVPWIVGAMAVTVVYAYKKPDNREKALANGMVSVFLGGIGAPYSGQILSQYVSPVYANDWVLAGILGAGWPWLLPIALSFIKRKSEKAADE
jgi:MFS family permease